MGKLLQKLVHQLVPSWLTKVKSANPSARKALPSFKPAGRNHTSDANKPPSSSSTPTQSSNNSTGVIPLVHDEVTQQDESTSSIATSLRSSSDMPTHKSEAEKVDSNTLHEHEEPQPSSLHVKEKICRHTYDQRKQDDDTSLQSNRSGGYTGDLDAVGLHVYSTEETGNSQKELQHKQVGIPQHGSHEIECNSSGYFESAYKELLGCKRKSQSLQGDWMDDEEGEEDEEEELGGSGSDDIKVRWAWKRRKGEKGILSCELPESICSIVGNGRAVVKQSLEPQLALWESMVEMIVGNGLHEMGNLEFLLYCYLSLNEPHLYPLIQESFLQVLKDLERIA